MEAMATKLSWTWPKRKHENLLPCNAESLLMSVGREALKRRFMEIRNTVKIEREDKEEEENQSRSSLVDFREEVGAGRV